MVRSEGRYMRATTEKDGVRDFEDYGYEYVEVEAMEPQLRVVRALS